MISEPINMESLLSIQDQYLNAVATLLSANQQPQQQQHQHQHQQQQQFGKQQLKPAKSFNHHEASLLLSTSSKHDHQQQHHKSPRKPLNNQPRRRVRHPQVTSSASLLDTPATSSPLDLSKRPSASSSPSHGSNLSASLIRQSAPASLPLDLVTKQHEADQRQAIRLVTSSRAPPLSSSASSCVSSRPSSANSGAPIQEQATSGQISSSNAARRQSGSSALPTPSSGTKKLAKSTRSHPCNHCGRSFSRSDMLTRHSRLHSGLKPYQCAKCLQVFSRSDHLSTHERTHTGEKPYQCNFCSYSACRRDMITRHLRTHTGTSVVSELELKKLTRARRNRTSKTAIGSQMDDQLDDDDDVSTSANFSSSIE